MAAAQTQDSLGMEFDAAVLGAGLPAQVEALISRAGLLRSDAEQAESLLLQARDMAPMHPATLIALYRFYFYGHRLGKAREVAIESLKVARAALEPLAEQGGALGVLGLRRPISVEQARFDAAVRFYLFSLKGYAYLSLRMGDIDTGKLALGELRRLDPQDHVGGGVLAKVLARVEAGEPSDDESPEAIAMTASLQAPRGWSAP
jgi:multidrug efflux pump subunit AcrA (membrane-fusion protein)